MQHIGKVFNGITIRDIENLGEYKVFSFIMQRAKEINYGSMDLSFTIKKGKVVNIREKMVETNFNIKI